MDGYLFFRKLYGTWSGSLSITAFTGTTTLVTNAFKGQNIIYVQNVHMNVNVASPGVTWTVEDSNGVDVTGPVSAAVTGPPNNGFDFNFGPVGFALTPGTNLVFTPSAPGAVGVLSWDAYQRQRTDVPVVP